MKGLGIGSEGPWETRPAPPPIKILQMRVTWSQAGPTATLGLERQCCFPGLLPRSVIPGAIPRKQPCHSHFCQTSPSPRLPQGECFNHTHPLKPGSSPNSSVTLPGTSQKQGSFLICSSLSTAVCNPWLPTLDRLPKLLTPGAPPSQVQSVCELLR